MKHLYGMMLSLILVFFLTIILDSIYGIAAAWVTMITGTTLVLGFWMVVALNDSKHRWPGKPWYTRFNNIMCFRR